MTAHSMFLLISSAVIPIDTFLENVIIIIPMSERNAINERNGVATGEYFA